MTEPIQVLIIDDSEADAELIRSQLVRDGCFASYHRVDTVEGLSKALEQQSWDIALCDYVMPRFSGLDALKFIREKRPDLPCIIVSGQIGEEIAVTAMKAGANDYIMKDRLKRLAPAIKREIDEARVHLEKQEIQKALHAKEEELRFVRELERAKDEFIGFVSHELRTPLTVVIGALHTVLTNATLLPEEDKLNLIRDSLSEAEGLADMIENLLYVARAQANKMQTDLRPVAPSVIIYDTLEKIKTRAVGRQFIVDCPESIKVKADPFKVKVILNNLLNNATKYSPLGEIRISVNGKDDMVVFAVTDQGMGISEENQKKLFQPFERLAISSGHTKGIGLGLLVCQRLTEAQGGKIWVESQPGKGSTFYFALPQFK